MEMLGLFIPDPYLDIPRGLSSPKDVFFSEEVDEFAGEIVAAKVTGDGGGLGALSMEAWCIFRWNLWGNMLAMGGGPPNPNHTVIRHDHDHDLVTLY